MTNLCVFRFLDFSTEFGLFSPQRAKYQAPLLYFDTLGNVLKQLSDKFRIMMYCFFAVSGCISWYFVVLNKMAKKNENLSYVLLYTLCFNCKSVQHVKKHVCAFSDENKQNIFETQPIPVQQWFNFLKYTMC